jgi:pantetheine-phosphate adenylyltransferase
MYPGTFDPLTNGHHELVLRAAELFDQVVVAVAESPGKTPIFSFEERMDMARQVLSEIKNVSVDGYAGLTVDYAREHEVNLIVRGLRAATDFEYEFQLASMNRHLQPGIETVFLTSTDEYNFLSSSLVREVASLGGDVSKFIHPKVGRLLRKRFPNN